MNCWFFIGNCIPVHPSIFELEIEASRLAIATAAVGHGEESTPFPSSQFQCPLAHTSAIGSTAEAFFCKRLNQHAAVSRHCFVTAHMAVVHQPQQRLLDVTRELKRCPAFAPILQEHPIVVCRNEIIHLPCQRVFPSGTCYVPS